jgi:hypothetical protein
MVYIKSLIAGVVGFVVALVGAGALTAVTLAIQVMSMKQESGSGGIGAVSSGLPPVLIGVIGFVIGFVWQFRRARRAATR